MSFLCSQFSQCFLTILRARGMESKILIMARKYPMIISELHLWTHPLSLCIIPPILDVEDARHISTSRFLNLQFPLSGILFPQIRSWLTPALPLGFYKCHLIREAFSAPMVESSTQAHRHTLSLSLSYSPPFTLLYFFSWHFSPYNFTYCSSQLECKLLEGRMFVSLIHCVLTAY